MFLDNKYTRWYWLIINKAKSNPLSADVYSEKHHILPRCLGGDNSKDNLIRLTAKEHYLVHLLLTKMGEGRAKYKLQVAFWRMCAPKTGRRIINNRQYETAKHSMKLALSKLNKGKPLPDSQKQAMKGKPAHNRGSKISEDHRQRIIKYRSENRQNTEINSKISNTLKEYHSKKKANGNNKCPKFIWHLKNAITNEINETNNLREWCKSKGFTSAMIYKQGNDWRIISKERASC